ncbi:MAG: hypothetical protein IKQ46_17660 [Bacteroidales bacterium]|nr:hypothetical protein [Bacteroidales bacterium]
MMQRYGDGGAKPLPNFLAKCANPIVFQNTFINFAIVMSNNIKKISVKKDFSLLPPSKDNVITPDFLFVTDSDKVGRMFVQTFQPYQLSEGRFIRVIGGKARLLANLKMYDLYCGTVVCLPPAAIIEYQSISDYFKIQAFSYDTMPQPFGFDKVTVL